MVIPVYNQISGLERALISVVNQSFTPSQIIIVDDGSDREVADEICKISTDYSVRLVRHDANKGVSQARNTGISVSESEWVALIDADDYWDLNFLESTLDVAVKQSADLVGTAYYYLHANGVFSESEISLNRSLGSVFQVDDYFRYAASGDLPFTCSSVLLARKIVMKSGLFEPGLSMGEDQIFWYQLIRSGCRSFVLNRFLSTYDLSTTASACNSISKVSSWQFVKKINHYSLDDSSPYKQKFLDKNGLKAFAYSILYGQFDLAAEIRCSPLISSGFSRMIMSLLLFIPKRVASSLVAKFYEMFGKR